MLSRYLVLVVTILAGVALGAPPFEVPRQHPMRMRNDGMTRWIWCMESKVLLELHKSVPPPGPRERYDAETAEYMVGDYYVNHVHWGGTQAIPVLDSATLRELDKFSDECSREEKFWFRTNRRTPAEAPAHEQEQAKAGPENRGTVPGEGGQHDPPGPSIHPTHFARTGGLLGQAHTFFHRLSHTLSVPHLRPMMRGGRAPVLEPVMKGMKVPIYDY